MVVRLCGWWLAVWHPVIVRRVRPGAQPVGVLHVWAMSGFDLKHTGLSSRFVALLTAAGNVPAKHAQCR